MAFKLSVGKERGKSKVMPSCTTLSGSEVSSMQQTSRVGLANSVAAQGVEQRKRAKQLRANEKARRSRKCEVRFCSARRNCVWQRTDGRIGTGSC